MIINCKEDENKKEFIHTRKSIYLDAIHEIQRSKKSIIFGEIYHDECSVLEIQFMLI